MFGKNKKEEVSKVEVKVELSVLNKQQYEALEKAVGYMSVNDKTTAIETAYMLGIQHVLKKLRDGYVSGS